MLIAGVDEAGRGPLAGPVTVGAVILQESIAGLDDSKKLTEATRRDLVEVIKAKSMAWSVVHIEVPVIDQINILQATLLGMRQAVSELSIKPGKVLVDGNRVTEFGVPAEAIVGGDGLVPSISAASILAKEARDALMRQLDQEFPQYGFAQHKGYGTKQHLEALEACGPCGAHRTTFAPVKKLIQQEMFE